MIPTPHRILMLADVLTADELAGQPWASHMVLNGRPMPEQLGEYFARMGDSERRMYVLCAIEFARLGRWHLQDALIVLLELSNAPPSRWESR